MGSPRGGERAVASKLSGLFDVRGEWIRCHATAKSSWVDSEETGGIEAEDVRFHIVSQGGIAVSVLKLSRDLKGPHGHDLRLRAPVPNGISSPHHPVHAHAAEDLPQGVGRLIRAKTDSGVVAVLDNRVLTKRYGRAFLDAAPKCPVEIV